MEDDEEPREPQNQKEPEEDLCRICGSTGYDQNYQPCSCEAGRKAKQDAEAKKNPPPPKPKKSDPAVRKRLEQVYEIWKLGARVQARDKEDESWMPGQIASTRPVKVKLDGSDNAFSYRMIEADLSHRQRSLSPVQWGKAQAKKKPVIRTPSVERNIRASRELSQRRRSKEREETVKEAEETRLRQRKPENHEKAERARIGVEYLTSPDRQPEAHLREQIRGWLKEAENESLGQGLTAAKVKRVLVKHNVELDSLALLTVKERKKLLETLGHRSPSLVSSGKDFVEWFKGQLWSQKNSTQRPNSAQQEILRRLTSTPEAEGMARLREKIEEMRSEGEKIGLAQLVKLLASLSLGLTSLARLTVKERIRLLDDLGHPLPRSGAPEATFLEWLFCKVKSSKVRSTQPSRALSEALGKLASTDLSEILATLRTKLDERRGDEENPLSLLELESILNRLGLDLEDLSLLPLNTMKRMMESLGYTGYGGSKEDILSRLKYELWHDRVVRRCPSGKQLESLERLANPIRHDYDGSEEETEEEGGDELLMQFDMYVPAEPMGAWHWMEPGQEFVPAEARDETGREMRLRFDQFVR
eukprot:TRINITY_DN109900_c0_g1_i1.p1 TRINITY_DN109900_c0_g1~~TRINITY_DN109900_c0_g1_i1.p1  ORF type:complete len:613 (+),score=115.63 TRINITY_DN109900_c0_g1_i1:76-1839(+)